MYAGLGKSCYDHKRIILVKIMNMQNNTNITIETCTKQTDFTAGSAKFGHTVCWKNVIQLIAFSLSRVDTRGKTELAKSSLVFWLPQPLLHVPHTCCVPVFDILHWPPHHECDYKHNTLLDRA